MRLICFCVVVTVSPFADSAAIAAERKKEELSTSQRRAMKRWLADFKKSRRSRSRRTNAAKRLAALGEPAVRELLKVVNNELNPALQKYEAAFQKQAAAIAAKKITKEDLAEIQRLRTKVLALRKRGDLTKAMITREADPALITLRRLVSIDAKLILAKLPKKVSQNRKDLLTLGRYWEFCVNKLAATKTDGNRRRAASATVSFTKYLSGREQLAAQPLTMDPHTKAVFAANALLYGKLDPEEARCIQACNATRNLLGLPILAIDVKLVAAARDHSSDMNRLRFFAHTSPVAGKRTPYDRARRFGTTASGENIFRGIRSGLTAHTGWFHSPGHHRNMLGSHKRIGVGRHGKYFTQMFGR